MIGGRAAGRDLAGSRHEHGRRRRLGPRRALWTEALRLESLNLNNAAIGDAGLVASRRRPAPGASQILSLGGNPLGDGGLAALVAPPRPAGAPPPPTGVLTKLQMLVSSATPRSPTPAAPPSPLRSTAARCRRSRS